MNLKDKQICGLTIMSPVINDRQAEISHVQQLRTLLSQQPRDSRSPFANFPGTHTARLAILDSLPFVNLSAEEEYLESPYLIFEANVDDDRDSYLTAMAKCSPTFLDAVWSHCIGYPGASDPAAFVSFMKKCQLDTTLFFADVNDKSVSRTLEALQVQRSVLAFIGKNQDKRGTDLKHAFIKFMNDLHGFSKTIDPSISVSSNE